MQKITNTTETRFPPVVSDRKLAKSQDLHESVTINKPREEVFRFWRDFTHLPIFIEDLSIVEFLSETKSRWTIELPFEQRIQWDVEIIAERVNELITWRSTEPEKMDQRGTVLFRTASGGRGTVVSLSLHYTVPGGKVGEFAGKLIGEDTRTLTLKSLHRLKAYLEVGEIPTTIGQSSGRDPKDRELEVH